MARVVVVASSDVPRAALEEHVAPEDELRVLVLAVEQSRLQWLTNDEDEARSEAARVGRTIERSAPGSASVQVKSEAPRQLIRDAVAEHEPDSIVVALREGEEATWLEEGELASLPSHIDGVPVTRIRVPG